MTMLDKGKNIAVRRVFDVQSNSMYIVKKEVKEKNEKNNNEIFLFIVQRV